MTWLMVAEWIKDKCCREAQHFGRCGCITGRKGRKYNPCQRNAGLVAGCNALEDGEPTSVTPGDVLTWASTQTCNASRRNHGCNHRGCIRGEEIISWLTEQVRKTAA